MTWRNDHICRVPKIVAWLTDIQALVPRIMEEWQQTIEGQQQLIEEWPQLDARIAEMIRMLEEECEGGHKP